MSRVQPVATASPVRYLARLESAWAARNAPRLSSAPTVISLFAGGGGSSLGYQMAGFRELLAADWDENAVVTLRHNNPGLDVLHGDIAEQTVRDILVRTGLATGELDVLDGSPPCQGFSMAGKRHLEDPRNSLFREFVRILQGLQPRAFIMENVAGMVKGKMRLVFVDCLQSLKACGYDVSARVLNAMYFGIPQQRQRLILIGTRRDLNVAPSHPRPITAPHPLRDALGAARLAPASHGEPVTLPPLDDRYGRLWDQVPLGGNASDVLGTGYSSCVKPHPDRPSPTLPKTQTGRGFATVVHPFEPRALTIAEAAYTSSYPPAYHFVGSYTERWARIGNSVPPLFMAAIASHVRNHLLGHDTVPVQDVA
jgi:DNA (cytosine-5)-methyltransferase 1